MKIILLILIIIVYTPSLSARLNRVYHPYVSPLESEIEYRTLLQETDNGTDLAQLQLLGYGQSVDDNIFLEFYLISENSDSGKSDLSDITAYEAEALIQLTEQGEFWADWGLLFEVEKVEALSVWEASSGLLIEKEWGRWSGTGNFFLIYEYGDDYKTEWQTAVALQMRYRYSKSLEPSVELYSSEYGTSIGPAINGQISFSEQNISWELGVQFAVDRDAPATYVRILLEYEF